MFLINFFSILSYNITSSFFKKREISFGAILRLSVILASIGAIIIIPLFLLWADIGKIYSLKNYQPPIPSQLLDRKGRLISTFFIDNRILITEKELPEKLVQSFTSIEDNHFFSHYGIDLQSIFRAFLKNIIAGGVKQGGSTITQQLAKVILTTKERTLTRKAKEAVLSIALENFFTKKKILTLYFNEIYLGHGNYGIEAASVFYFGKKSKELDYFEAAILASLPSAPNRFSPYKNPKRSFYRSKRALYHMYDMGHLSRNELINQIKKMVDYYSNLNESPGLTAFGSRVNKAPYFTEWLRRKLEEKLGREALYTKGYKIYSSLDLDHQKAAQEALWKGLIRQNKTSKKHQFSRQVEIANKYTYALPLIQLAFDLPDLKNKKTLKQYEISMAFTKKLIDYADLLNLGIVNYDYFDRTIEYIRRNNPYATKMDHVQGSFIEVDNLTGEVTVMVGGMPFNSRNQINRTIQIKRQPGSTFKALLYSSAIDTQKITAASIYPDTPLVFLDPSGGNWIPSNYSGGYRGFISVREALQYSVNLVSIAIARDVGLESLLPRLARLLAVGVKDIPPNLSIALGTYEVSPFQMARAISVIPNGGTMKKMILYTKITDNNNNIIDQKPKAVTFQTNVISSQACAVMDNLLKNVVDHGTGVKIRSVGYKGYAAGKTGTTSNFRDAWFVGYNHRYSSALWIGYDRSSKTLGIGQSGGNIATPIWGSYQKKVYSQIKDEKKVLNFGGINYVKVCKQTGLLPHEGCQNVYTMPFIPGTEPEEKGTGVFMQTLNDSQSSDVMESSDFFENDEF